MSLPHAASGAQQRELIDTVLAAEQGGRRLEGRLRLVVVNVAVAWSLFQLWTASPLSFWLAGEVRALSWVVFDDTAVRSIHLAFAVFLVYMSFPMRKRSARDTIPAYDWVFAVVAAFCASYIYVFNAQLIERPGAPIARDIVVSVVGTLLLLEATRRSLGWPMTIVAATFLAYVFAGPYLPGLIAHKGATLSRVTSQMWITTEGVFGIALGVSASFDSIFSFKTTS